MATRGPRELSEFILGDLVLGKGSFSQVKVGQELSTGEVVAVKIIPHAKLNATELECVATEVAVLRLVNHPNVVRYLDHFSDDQRTLIMLEYVAGGHLGQYLRTHKTMPDAEARRLMRQMLEAVRHCHALHIAHRDLKLEHVLLDLKRNVKIIDFGLACRSPPDELQTQFCGSHLYVAPEILRKQPYLPQKVDIWSLGIIFYLVLFGTFPFFSTDPAELARLITAGEVRFPRAAQRHSPEAKALVLRMLSFDPQRRPSCDELLASEWLATVEASDDAPIDDDWFDDYDDD